MTDANPPVRPAQVTSDEEGLRNKRALPRVLLVAEAEAVNGAEAFLRIQGDSAREFDPRSTRSLSRTALLEVSANDLSVLPGGSTDSNSGVVEVHVCC